MKIAYLSNTRFPSERAHALQIVHMCNAFASAEHEVTLYVTNRETSIKDTPESYYGTPLNFIIAKIPVPDIAGNISFFPKFLRPGLYTFQRFMYGIRILFAIHDGSAIFYGRDEWVLAFVSFFKKNKIVWESHEAKYNLPAQYILKKGVKCVCISEGIFEAYTLQGVNAKQMIVAHDGIDESFFDFPIPKTDARKKLGLEPLSKVAMYIGGFDAWKGVQTFFDSSARLSEVTFVAIGGKENELEDLRAQYPTVHFLGPRSYKELKEHQQAADVLVVPNTAKNNLSAKYTSPLKLFAHMASNIPLVVSDIESIRNILNETQATFFEADNPDSLAHAIQDVLARPEEAALKASASYELSKEYTWKRRAKNILDFIQK